MTRLTEVWNPKIWLFLHLYFNCLLRYGLFFITTTLCCQHARLFYILHYQRVLSTNQWGHSSIHFTLDFYIHVLHNIINIYICQLKNLNIWLIYNLLKASPGKGKNREEDEQNKHNRGDQCDCSGTCYVCTERVVDIADLEPAWMRITFQSDVSNCTGCPSCWSNNPQ